MKKLFSLVLAVAMVLSMACFTSARVGVRFVSSVLHIGGRKYDADHRRVGRRHDAVLSGAEGSL